MMRFRCPTCQHVLELTHPTQAALCPACQQWCRIPIPDEFELSQEPSRQTVERKEEALDEPRLAALDQPEEILEVVAVPESASRPPRDAIINRRPEELPPGFRDHTDEVEDVEFEIVEHGDERPRKPRRPRRRRRRRSSGGRSFDIDYWTSPSLILLLVTAPPALIASLVFFIVHPAMGFGCLLMMGGGIWFTIIAAEDGWMTALLVLFVPFYAWYYTLNNWERVGIPALIQLIGIFIFFVSMGMLMSRIDDGRWSNLPAPIVRTLAPPVG
jgi:hypothetical protein